MYFRIWKNPSNGWWYWHMRSSNHEIIANGEGYTSEQGCRHVIRLIDGGRNLPVYVD